MKLTLTLISLLFVFNISARTEAESIDLSYSLYPETKNEVEAYSTKLNNLALELSQKSPTKKADIIAAKEYAIKKFIFKIDQFKEARKSYLRSIVSSGQDSAAATFSYLVAEDQLLLANFLKLDSGAALTTSMIATATPTSTPIPTASATAIATPSPTPTLAPASVATTADFFKLVVVPNQSIVERFFEVQVIAENLDLSQIVTAPVVIDHSGTSHVMTLKTLKWPGTTEDSISLYSSTIPLTPDSLNNVRIVSGTKEITFSLRHKSNLSILSAANTTELRAHIKSAIADGSIDVVEVNYDEADLGAILNSLGSGVTNRRTTWFSVKPASGKSLKWARDSGTPMRRPFIDFIKLSNVIFGSDISDGGGGHYYTERNHRIWIDNAEFRSKYKASWLKNTPMTAAHVSDIRSLDSEGQKIYLTNCLWDGTASISATSSVALARDLRFNSHRGDFNNFGKVFINALASDIMSVRVPANTDYLHNDGFQVWGTSEGVIFKGFKVISPNVLAELQPLFLSRTYSPNYTNFLMDTVIIENSLPGTSLQAQFAGIVKNTRISNIKFQGQAMTFRQDFVAPDGPYISERVYVHNVDVYNVSWMGPEGKRHNYNYNSTLVTNTEDISSALNVIPSMSGTIFSKIRIAPRP